MDLTDILDHGLGVELGRFRLICFIYDWIDPHSNFGNFLNEISMEFGSQAEYSRKRTERELSWVREGSFLGLTDILDLGVKIS